MDAMTMMTQTLCKPGPTPQQLRQEKNRRYYATHRELHRWRWIMARFEAMAALFVGVK